MKTFSAGDYELVLEHSLLLALDGQTRWAVKTGMVAASRTPNYLDFVHIAALKSVKPHAVMLIY